MRLYHFMKEEYALKIIINQRLKVARIRDLNDPFEINGIEINSLADAEALQTIKDKTHEKLGIICFSSDYSNPLMWGHYADKHAGICLGFDINDELLNNGYLIKVNYETEKARIELSEDNINLIQKVLIENKYKDWKYENEYRLFSNLNTIENDIYYEYFNENLTLKEIIIGYECNKPTKENIEQIRPHLKNIELFQAGLSNSEFKVTKRPIK